MIDCRQNVNENPMIAVHKKADFSEILFSNRYRFNKNKNKIAEKILNPVKRKCTLIKGNI